MARYIDVDLDVSEYVTVWDCDCSELGKQTVIAVEDLQYLPTADVVEVVRCKDCVYCRPYHDGKLYCHRKANIFIPIVDADDYCSYGERREE